MGDVDPDVDTLDRADAERRDEADPLAGFGERFAVPDGERYMDGSSLGLAPAAAEASLERVVEEWRDLAVRGWEAADPDWFTYAERVSDRLASLVGARDGEVAVANFHDGRHPHARREFPRHARGDARRAGVRRGGPGGARQRPRLPDRPLRDPRAVAPA